MRVEALHQYTCRYIVDVPEARDDRRRAREDERARQPNHLVAVADLAKICLAGAQDDEIGFLQVQGVDCPGLQRAVIVAAGSQC